MSNTASPIVTFTEDEQKKLRELSDTLKHFDLYSQLIFRANHRGEDALLVVQAIRFFEGMSKQVQAQIDVINAGALSRILPQPQENK